MTCNNVAYVSSKTAFLKRGVAIVLNRGHVGQKLYKCIPNIDVEVIAHIILYTFLEVVRLKMLRNADQKRLSFILLLLFINKII